MPRDISLAEVFERYGENLKQDLHIAIPARVLAYHASSQTVDCEAVAQRPIPADDGSFTFESLPAFPSVPVAWLGGGGFTITFPLAAGDHVLLVFSSFAIGDWRSTGQAGQQVDTRIHSPGYPVAIPCVRPDTSPLGDAGFAGALMGQDGAQTQVRVSSSQIQLGASATVPVALATPTLTALNAIQTTFTALEAAISALGPAPLTGASLAAVFATPLANLASALITAATSVPATLVKAQ